jgi:hypothetical protein
VHAPAFILRVTSIVRSAYTKFCDLSSVAPPENYRFVCEIILKRFQSLNVITPNVKPIDE